MSLAYLLGTAICRTFERVAGKWQSKKPEPKAFVVEFSTSIDHDKEEGYRYVDLVIYAECNYVNVYARERWNVIPLEDLEYNEEEDDTYVKPGKDYVEGSSPWTLLCSHDSGWTSAVQEFLSQNARKLQTFGASEDFYKLVDPKELGI